MVVVCLFCSIYAYGVCGIAQNKSRESSVVVYMH